jgi:2-isopropylmalate synthase
VSRLVAAHSRAPVDSRRPVIGKNAFHHKAKLHIHSVSQDENAYSWISPSTFHLQATTYLPELPFHPHQLINASKVISATELKHHREGIGYRHVMIDERFVPDCRQYCIVREISEVKEEVPSHVDPHRHMCDSLFLFIGKKERLTGLTVEVQLGNATFHVTSPASVFIPAGVEHTYRILRGEGLYINHVLSGCYNDSLLDPMNEIMYDYHIEPQGACVE